MKLNSVLSLSIGVFLMGSLNACAATAGTAGRNDLVIAADGQTDAIIVVSPQARPDEKQAADDLAKYIGLMCGATPAIANTPEAIAAALNSDSPLLIVGEEAIRAKPALRAALQRVVKKDPVLRSDAIALRREGNRVYLAGNNDPSHYYAVAELLGRWGCRWFIATEFGECIPQSPTLKIGDLDYLYSPPFEVRTYWISWNGDYTGYAEFQKRNMMTQDVGVPSGHAIGQYVQDIAPGGNVYGIRLTDPATAEHIAKKIEDQFAKGAYISLGMEDGMYDSDYPQDQELMKLQWDKYFMRWSVSDAFMTLYNNVCRVLVQKYPNSTSKIGFLAYSNMTIPPVRPTVAEKPLVAYLAPIDIDPIHGMDDPQSPPRQEYKDILYGWAKVMQGRVAIYDYDQGMLVWRDIPNPSHQSFRQDVKHYRDAGILGVGTESRNAIATTFINLYMRGRLMWNPDEDVDALLADFYPRFYGPAAEPMSAYWNTIFKAWEETICTEHEYFVAPAIYTPQVMAVLSQKLQEAEALVAPLRNQERTRNDELYLKRMDFTRMGFEILEGYMKTVKAAATDVDYAAAVAAGEKALPIREKLTDTNGIFTTYRRYPEGGYMWWPGEVQQYKELLEYTDGTKGKLLAKLPLQWAFRRDSERVGLEKGYQTQPVDLTYWEANGANYTLDSRKDYPDEWEMLNTDLYIQAQGVRHPDRQSFVGDAWYRTGVELTAEQAQGAVHIRFPGLFNECWLYVNGVEVAHREQGVLWWLNDYRFEWDVDLTRKLQAGANTIALRANCIHHFGGMFRRPFLYVPVE